MEEIVDVGHRGLERLIPGGRIQQIFKIFCVFWETKKKNMKNVKKTKKKIKIPAL